MCLPKRIPTEIHLKLYPNEKSLWKKETGDQFQIVVREYNELDHAEPVPRDEL